MNRRFRSILTTLLILALALALAHFFPAQFDRLDSELPPAATAAAVPEEPAPETDSALPDEDGAYDDRDTLALYIHLYGHLPPNFVTKAEAEAAGWTGGDVKKVLPGKCIGGSRFGNREGLLPSAKGRVWTECDVNTLGKSSRGAERIVFSNDGLIYYTPDHYESFELLYGSP